MTAPMANITRSPAPITRLSEPSPAGSNSAIGFLANYLGFGRLGPKIKEMVEKLQKKVEKCLEWLIDRAIAIWKSILDALGGGKAAEGDVVECFQMVSEGSA